MLREDPFSGSSGGSSGESFTNSYGGVTRNEKIQRLEARIRTERGGFTRIGFGSNSSTLHHPVTFGNVEPFTSNESHSIENSVQNQKEIEIENSSHGESLSHTSHINENEISSPKAEIQTTPRKRIKRADSQLEKSNNEKDFPLHQNDIKINTSEIASPQQHQNTKRNGNSQFTKEEDEILLEGVRMKGENWKEIAEWAGSRLNRQPRSLASRFKKIQQSYEGQKVTPLKQSISRKDSSTLPNQSNTLTGTTLTPAKSENQPTLAKFFTSQIPENSNKRALPLINSDLQTSGSKNKKIKNTESIVDIEKEDAIAAIALANASAKWEELIRIERSEKQKLAFALDHQVEENKKFKLELQKIQEVSVQTSNLASRTIESILREHDKMAARRAREDYSKMGVRLGRVVVQKTGVGPRATNQEYWENGYLFRDLQDRHSKLEQMKEELEKRRKHLVKSSRGKKISPVPQFNSSNGLSLSSPILDTSVDLELLVLDETYKSEVQKLKKEEEKLQIDEAGAEIEKVVFIREIKRLRDEDASRFNKQPLLNNRYLLRSLLGKGGFSEVWRAYDVVELKDVAVKIHELNSTWTSQRKGSYFKHATREYKIHINLAHHHIVRLFDVFEIDANSFATVLEFCDGTDLDLLLKKQKLLPEKEARVILLQLLAGLKYLNTGETLADQNQRNNTDEGTRSLVIFRSENSSERNDEDDINDDYEQESLLPKKKTSLNVETPTKTLRTPRVIHYDLKPGNILFDKDGNVKITDFGLSKIVEPEYADSSGIELTSQGAGTYWYLPPECFRLDSSTKISSKVDVWSTGVIFYQMLFGKRPFGDGMTQDKILADQTMLRAKHVEFPEKPVVTQGAKEFIISCLTFDQDLRPDVLTICAHPYLFPATQGSKKKSIQ